MAGSEHGSSRGWFAATVAVAKEVAAAIGDVCAQATKAGGLASVGAAGLDCLFESFGSDLFDPTGILISGLVVGGAAGLNEIIRLAATATKPKKGDSLYSVQQKTKAISDGVDDSVFYTLNIGGRLLPLIIVLVDLFGEIDRSDYNEIREVLLATTGISVLMGLTSALLKKFTHTFFEYLSPYFEGISAFVNTQVMLRLFYKTVTNSNEEEPTPAKLFLTMICLIVAAGKFMQQRYKVHKKEFKFEGLFLSIITALNAGAILQACISSFADYFNGGDLNDDPSFALKAGVSVASLIGGLFAFWQHRSKPRVEHATVREVVEKFVEAFIFSVNACWTTLTLVDPVYAEDADILTLVMFNAFAALSAGVEAGVEIEEDLERMERALRERCQVALARAVQNTKRIITCKAPLPLVDEGLPQGASDRGVEMISRGIPPGGVTTSNPLIFVDVHGKAHDVPEGGRAHVVFDSLGSTLPVSVSLNPGFGSAGDK